MQGRKSSISVSVGKSPSPPPPPHPPLPQLRHGHRKRKDYRVHYGALKSDWERRVASRHNSDRAAPPLQKLQLRRITQSLLDTGHNFVWEEADPSARAWRSSRLKTAGGLTRA